MNERNVCSQERDKDRVDATRQWQQALFEERAHSVALNRRLAASRTRGTTHCQKLRDAPRAVEAAERAVVEAGCRTDRKHQPYCPSA